jgi:hypothetical protein
MEELAAGKVFGACKGTSKVLATCGTPCTHLAVPAGSSPVEDQRGLILDRDPASRDAEANTFIKALKEGLLKQGALVDESYTRRMSSESRRKPFTEAPFNYPNTGDSRSQERESEKAEDRSCVITRASDLVRKLHFLYRATKVIREPVARTGQGWAFSESKGVFKPGGLR